MAAGRRAPIGGAVLAGLLLAGICFLLLGGRLETPPGVNPVLPAVATPASVPEVSPVEPPPPHPSLHGPSTAAPAAPLIYPTWTFEVESRRPDGSPAKEARVLFSGEDRSAPVEGLTSEEGRASLEVRGPGRLVAYHGRLAPWTGESMDPPESGTRQVAVQLEEGLAVEGVVLEQDGTTPAHPQRVRVHRSAPFAGLALPPSEYETITTSADGRFRVVGLLPGKVTLSAGLSASEAGGAASVEAEAGATDVRIVLSAQACIDFLIVDAETGKAPQGVWLEIYRVTDRGPGLVATFTSPQFEGSPPREAKPFGTCPVLPGEKQRFRVRCDGYSGSGDIDVEVPPGVRRKTVRVELQPNPGSICTLVLVLSPLPAPVPERLGVTRNYEGGSTGIKYPVKDGLVELRLPEGHNSLTIGGNIGRPEPDDPWLPLRLDVDLSRGERLTCEVALERGGFVRIFAPVGISLSTLRISQGGDAIPGTPWVRGTEGDIHEWIVGPIPPGEWDLQAPAPGGGSFRQHVSILPGEVTELRVPAHPAAGNGK